LPTKTEEKCQPRPDAAIHQAVDTHRKMRHQQCILCHRFLSVGIRRHSMGPQFCSHCSDIEGCIRLFCPVYITISQQSDRILEQTANRRIILAPFTLLRTLSTPVQLSEGTILYRSSDRTQGKCICQSTSWPSSIDVRSSSFEMIKGESVQATQESPNSLPANGCIFEMFIGFSVYQEGILAASRRFDGGLCRAGV
jgi:hypothetical protein